MCYVGTWRCVPGQYYNGYPVYYDVQSGSVAYEADFQKLVSVPHETQVKVLKALLEEAVENECPFTD